MPLLKPPVSVKCSSCNQGLFTVQVIDAEAKDPVTGKVFVWNIKSNCPYCGDRSFIKKIQGDYRIDGYYKRPGDEVSETFVDEVDTDEENVIVKVEKCNNSMV